MPSAAIVTDLLWVKISLNLYDQQYSVYNVLEKTNCVNFLLAGGDFCHLSIKVASSLDSDQDRHNVGPDLDPNCLTL